MKCLEKFFFTVTKLSVSKNLYSFLNMPWDCAIDVVKCFLLVEWVFEIHSKTPVTCVSFIFSLNSWIPSIHKPVLRFRKYYDVKAGMFKMSSLHHTFRSPLPLLLWIITRELMTFEWVWILSPCSHIKLSLYLNFIKTVIFSKRNRYTLFFNI